MDKTFWTDYPILELGDVPHKIAPVRKCKVVRWLSDKWLIAEAEGIQFVTKKFYVHPQKEILRRNKNEKSS